MEIILSNKVNQVNNNLKMILKINQTIKKIFLHLRKLNKLVKKSK